MGKKYKFQVLRGLHYEPQGTPPVGKEGDAGYKPASKDYVEGGVAYDAKGKRGKSIVETDTDLTAKFGAEKFQRLDSEPRRPDEWRAGKTGQEDDAPQGQGANAPVVSTLDEGKPEAGVEPGQGGTNLEAKAGEKKAAAKGGSHNDGLEEMTVDELRSMAEEYEIDLTGAKRKEDIIDRIRKG